MNTQVRTKTGTFRQKRADTMIKTIEKQYGKDLAVRGDMKLGTFLKEKGFSSLNQLIRKPKATVIKKTNATQRKSK